MEKKKKENKATNIYKKKTTKKNNSKKTTTKTNRKKVKTGFTLIELLAVIIILGILMIIAIPAVTSYISNSRKSAYITTAKNVINGTRVLVNSGKLDMYDTEVTYYIPAKSISIEGGEAESPFGKFVQAYVGVIYHGNGYKYFWISVDESGQGIKEITWENDLDSDNIESNIKPDDIIEKVRTTGINERSIIKVLNDNNKWVNFDAISMVNSDSDDENYVPSCGNNCICKRAKKLHTGVCKDYGVNNKGCKASGYTVDGSKGTTTIVYGKLGKRGVLSPGDAYNCDINNDGVFDEETERFYYVSDYYNVNATTPSFDSSKAVLIYYTNVTGGVTPTRTKNYEYYDSGYQSNNQQGPRTAVNQLPLTTQWKNPLLIRFSSRILRNELGGRTSSNGQTNLVSSFSYQNRAARFLTFQEAIVACGSGTFYEQGYVDKCNFFYENIGGYENPTNATSTTGSHGFWLENPKSDDNYAYYISGDFRGIFGTMTYYLMFGVRPAITINKTNIEQ